MTAFESAQFEIFYSIVTSAKYTLVWKPYDSVMQGMGITDELSPV